MSRSTVETKTAAGVHFGHHAHQHKVDAASSTAAMATQLCAGTAGMRQLVGELRTTAGTFRVSTAP